MFLRSIHLENFRRFQESELDFPQGVIGVIGPNGAGKSTLIEAVAWALYGNPASRTTKDRIRFQNALPLEPCRVTLEFEIAGDTYRVVRELSSSVSLRTGQQRRDSFALDAAVWVNGLLAARGNVVSNSYLEKLLGMDYLSFKTSVYAQQRELNALSDLTDSKRREVLVRMLGIERIDQAQKLLREERRNLQTRLETLREQIGNRIEIEQELEQLVQKKRQVEQDLAIVELKMSDLLSEKSQAEQHFSDLQKKFDRFRELQVELRGAGVERSGFESRRLQIEKERKEIEALRPVILQLQAETADYPDAKSRLAEYELLAIRAEQRQRLEKQVADLSSALNSDSVRLKELSESIKSLPESQARLQTLKKEMANQETRLESLRNEFQEIEAERRALGFEKEKFNEQLANINRLGPESECDRCRRPLGDDFETIRAHILDDQRRIDGRLMAITWKRDELKKEGEQVNQANKKARADRDQLENEIARRLKDQGIYDLLRQTVSEREAELSRLQTELKQLPVFVYDPAQHAALKEKVSILESKRDRLIALEQEVKREGQLEKEQMIIAARFQELEATLNRLKTELGELLFDEQEFKRSSEALERLQQAVQTKQLENQECRYQMALVGQQIQQVEKRLMEFDERKQAISVLEREFLYLNTLDELFSSFRVAMVGRIRPALSRYTRDLFVELCEGRYTDLELDENYNIEITDSGQKFELERFSGGERDLASLCLRLAISLSVSESANLESAFIILDEIFGSQDQSRQENILQNLGRLKGRFRQIFLITHIEEIKDAVENLIYVQENSDGTSELILQ